MTESAVEVVGVYRKCERCWQWKPLAHFLLMHKSGKVLKNVHRCAACRGRGL